MEEVGREEEGAFGAVENGGMGRPLVLYLVSSSHNTYLTGGQLRSSSSAAMYRVVLKRGCRYVEVDVWDGDDGMSVLKHGHNMTSRETFENML